MSKKQILLHSQFLRELTLARSSSAYKQSSELEQCSKKAQELGLKNLSDCLLVESKLHYHQMTNDSSITDDIKSRINKLIESKNTNIVGEYFSIIFNQSTNVDSILNIYEKDLDSIMNTSNIEMLNGQLLTQQKDLFTQLPYIFIYFRCLSIKKSNNLIEKLIKYSNIIEHIDSYNNYQIQNEIVNTIQQLLNDQNTIEQGIQLTLKLIQHNSKPNTTTNNSNNNSNNGNNILQPMIKCKILQILARHLFVTSNEKYNQVFSQLQTNTSNASIGNIECEKSIEESLLVLLTCEQELHNSSTNNTSSSTSSTTYIPLKSEHEVVSLSNIYDQLTILFTSIYSNSVGYDLLKQLIQRGVTLYSESDHFWFQYAILLSNCKLYHRSFKIVESVCIPLSPRNLKYYLFACNIGLKCNKIEKSIHLAQQAIQFIESSSTTTITTITTTTTNNNPFNNNNNGSIKTPNTLNNLFKSKLYHILGLLYYKQSKLVSTMTEKNKCLETSVKILLQVNEEYDSNDYKLLYHIGLVYSEMREIKEAFSHVKKSINLNQDEKQSWILLALLFTSERDSHVQSFKIVKMILEQNPNDLKLKLLYARMEELLESSNNFNISLANEDLTLDGNNLSKSVRTYSKLSDELFKHLESFNTINDVNNTSRQLISIAEFRQRKIDIINYYIFISEALRRKKLLDDATFNMSKAKDLMIQLVEEIEEIESSKVSSLLPNTQPISSAQPKKKQQSTSNNNNNNGGGGGIETIQKTSRDYMTIIDLLLNNGRLQKDESQHELILLLKKTNALIHSCEGRIFEDSGKIKDATIEYEAALINDPDCEIAYLRLGIIFYKHEKQTTLSRNYLQNAVRINPTNYLSWYHLGKVLSEHFNDDEEASDCFMTSLTFEKTCPIIDFASDFVTLLV